MRVIEQALRNNADQPPIAFSSEMDAGSHSNQACADCVGLSALENASKQESRASVLIQSEPIMLLAQSPRPETKMPKTKTRARGPRFPIQISRSDQRGPRGPAPGPPRPPAPPRSP